MRRSQLAGFGCFVPRPQLKFCEYASEIFELPRESAGKPNPRDDRRRMAAIPIETWLITGRSPLDYATESKGEAVHFELDLDAHSRCDAIQFNGANAASAEAEFDEMAEEKAMRGEELDRGFLVNRAAEMGTAVALRTCAARDFQLRCHGARDRGGISGRRKAPRGAPVWAAQLPGLSAGRRDNDRWLFPGTRYRD